MDSFGDEIFYREKETFGHLSRVINCQGLKESQLQSRNCNLLGGFRKTRPIPQDLGNLTPILTFPEPPGTLSEEERNDLKLKRKMESVEKWIRECQMYRHCVDGMTDSRMFSYPFWMKTAVEMRKKRMKQRTSKDKAAEIKMEKRRERKKT